MSISTVEYEFLILVFMLSVLELFLFYIHYFNFTVYDLEIICRYRPVSRTVNRLKIVAGSKIRLGSIRYH